MCFRKQQHLISHSLNFAKRGKSSQSKALKSIPQSTFSLYLSLPWQSSIKPNSLHYFQADAEFLILFYISVKIFLAASNWIPDPNWLKPQAIQQLKCEGIQSQSRLILPLSDLQVVFPVFWVLFFFFSSTFSLIVSGYAITAPNMSWSIEDVQSRK